MNIALIFAGGTGQRYNPRAKPKQFLELYGKPIIIHAIEPFQMHSEINSICVVCKKEWIQYFIALKERYGISKARWIIEGGETSQESVYKGLQAIEKDVADTKDTIVLLNDGVRPLVDIDLISRNIKSVVEHGSAVTVASVTETVVSIDKNGMLTGTVERSSCGLAKAPQSFYLSNIIAIYERAAREGVNDIDAASLMLRYGKTMYTVMCSPDNIKITTPVDYFLYKAIYEARESEQVFGL